LDGKEIRDKTEEVKIAKSDASIDETCPSIIGI
jgi:hypothetical protein